MICAARTPALVAPGLPIDTVATGTPGGICTVESSASRPFSADESIGTPMTGRIVCAATTPPRCAAAPAPTMNTLTPREGASETSFMTRAGERCALATVISLEMPNSFNTSTAGCIVGASESDPINISTSGKGLPPDIATVLHAVERNQRCGVIRAIDRRAIIRTRRDDREHPSAGGHDVFSAPCRTRMKDRDGRHLRGGIEAVDDCATLY